MKKTIAILAACVLAASMFAGCSGKSSSSSADSSASSKAEETTAAATTAEATTEAATKSNTADITGAWENTYFTDSDGQTYKTTDYAAAFGLEEDAIKGTYTFDENGKSTCTSLGVTVEGTYTFDGTNVQVTFVGSAPKFVYNAEDDTLLSTDEASGVTTVMTRAEQ